jgi:hypothetical protein
MVNAWARRNWRQVVSVSRSGAGGIWLSPQDAADRGGPDSVTKLDQLTLNPLVSSGGILVGQALDQGGHNLIDGWTAQTGWILPFRGDQATMPAQDRARCDQAMSAQHLRQPPDQRGEDSAICPVQRGFGLVLRSTATS